MEEVFGSATQVAAMQTASDLWTLLRDDPRYCYYGRMVSVAGEQDGLADRLAALARLQGFVSCQFFPAVLYEGLKDEITARGLDLARWEQRWGRESAYRASRSWLDRHALPDGLTLRRVTPETPTMTVATIAALQMRYGVMPVPGWVMRGLGPKGISLYVEAADGTIVAAGSSFCSFHPDSRFATEAFWGMLATDGAWRGRRIASLLGAQIIVEMRERLGVQGFMTGVKADNASSLAMCARLGVEPSQFLYVGVSNPDIVSADAITH